MIQLVGGRAAVMRVDREWFESDYVQFVMRDLYMRTIDIFGNGNKFESRNVGI